MAKLSEVSRCGWGAIRVRNMTPAFATDSGSFLKNCAVAQKG